MSSLSFSQSFLGISIFFIVLGFFIPVRSQSSKLVHSTCRQGICSKTFLLNKEVIHGNELGGSKNTLYEVTLESFSYKLVSEASHKNQTLKQNTNWVYCSKKEPFVAFNSSTDDGLLILHYLNPGGTIGRYHAGSHNLYWATCHNLWDIDIWNPDDGLAQRAEELGYSLNLWQGQREIPKVMLQ